MSKIHVLNGRDERRPLIEKEMAEQGITNYRIWEGVHDSRSVVRSINLGHKMIVDYARARGHKSVTICEDDLKWTNPNSYKYYIENMPEVFDIYFGCLYLGITDDENVLITPHCGMILYTVHSRFYDTFLSVDENLHIDRALAGLGRYVVSNPFVCKQHDNIFSSNSGKVEDYSWQLRNYKFL